MYGSHDYNNNDRNRNSINNNIEARLEREYKKVAAAKETIFKGESNLNDGYISGLLERAEGSSPTLLEPINTAKVIFTKPICDPVGFRQHEGECANDAFQQVLLFSDSLKGITQPQMFDDSLPDRVADDELARYIKYMQARFRAHYGLLTGQIPYKAKRRASFISSFVCHTFFPDERVELRLDDYMAIKNALGLGKYRLKLNGEIEAHGYIMAMNIDRPVDTVLVEDKAVGHVVSLFICGGKYYLHDNEAGIIQINRGIYKNPTRWIIMRDLDAAKNYIVQPTGVVKNKLGEVVKIKIGSTWDEKTGTWIDGPSEGVMGISNLFVMRYSMRLVINKAVRITLKKTRKRRTGL